MEFLGNIGGFENGDLLTVGVLTLMEGVLSVDNALVLAILVRPLPEKLRGKALRWGMLGSIFFRVLAVIFASVLLKFTIFKFLGGMYLIYLAIKHMFFGLTGEIDPESLKKPQNYGKVIWALMFTDVVFSIDSIATAVAFSQKLWVLWTGGIAGIILLRFLSGRFVKLLDKFPKLEDLAYQLVFFVGCKLSFETLGVHIEQSVFWLMMGIIFTIGMSLVVRDHREKNVLKMKIEEEGRSSIAETSEEFGV